MRAYLLILCIISLISLSACGGTITGQAVTDFEVTEDAPEDDSDDVEEDEKDEHIIVEGPTEEEEKFAELYAGRTCEEDSLGMVRVFQDGKKTVYRNECFGNILIDYGCEGGKLVSENIKCPRSCEKDRLNMGDCS